MSEHTVPLSDVKPCPFCGGSRATAHRTARFPAMPEAEAADPDAGGYAWQVVCDSCAAEGPWRKSNTHDSALRAWQRREPTAEQKRRRKLLLDAADALELVPGSPSTGAERMFEAIAAAVGCEGGTYADVRAVLRRLAGAEDA